MPMFVANITKMGELFSCKQLDMQLYIVYTGYVTLWQNKISLNCEEPQNRDQAALNQIRFILTPHFSKSQSGVSTRQLLV